jgi:hypothetical protein
VPGYPPAPLPPPGSVPGPPPGPGLQAPFVAPPTDGTRRRRGRAIALILATVFVCCIGGVAGFGGLIVLGERAFVDEARGVVSKYLTALQHGDSATAYSLTCKQLQDNETESEFARGRGPSGVISFSVGNPSIEQNIIEVPVVLHYPDGDRSETFTVTQDNETGEFRVCGSSG